VNKSDEIRFGAGKSILFATIIFFTLLAMMEFSLRTWAYFFREQYERYDSESETFVLVPGEHRQGRRVIKINSAGFIGEELKTKTDEQIRIVGLGDSCTFGAGDYETAYPKLLDDLLSEGPGGNGRIEVINAGVEGHNSTMALSRYNYMVAPLEPDVVIVYIGWNDLMKTDPYGQSGENTLSAFVRSIDTLWITRGIRKAVFFYLRPSLNPPATGPESYRNTFEGFTPRRYQDNLDLILQSIVDDGAVPVLLTLPTVVRPNMTADDLKEAGVFFPYYPSAYAVGDFLQLVEAYNDVIRDAADTHGVPLIDIASDFSGLTPSTDYFYDTMHLSEKGRRSLAQKVAEYLRANNLFAGY
jgi:lysophospholipase L1-like esterase